MSPGVLRFDCRFTYPRGFNLDARFDLPSGISAMFGPSGSGKSTCLALIAGLLKPDHGSIQLNQTILVDRAARRWLPPHRRQVGVVFQDHLLFPHRTVWANLSYARTRAAGAAIRFDEMVEVLELGPLLERYPAQLSGGQQRRVALGRALLTQPRLLVMDEPLTGLEQSLRDRILEHLQQVHEQWHIPMLLVSHDQVAVRRLASHVVVLEAGRVIDHGSLSQTLDRATLHTMTSHPGPINLLRIEQVQQVGDHSEGLVGQQPFYLPRRTAGPTVYVRCLPRDVAITLDEVPRISMRNHLRGAVRDLVPISSGATGERVYVAIDVGQTLWAELTRAACSDLGLQPGKPVICLLKATALEQVT